jgi:hypothetical protein
LYVGILLYVQAASGNIVVRTGNAFGVAIGHEKEAVYQALVDRYLDENVRVTGRYYQGTTEMFRLQAPEAFGLLAQRDEWKLNFSEGRADYLRLTFQDEKLVKIERIWRPFSIP